MALCRRYSMSVADPGLQHARLGAAEVLWQCVVSDLTAQALADLLKQAPRIEQADLPDIRTRLMADDWAT